MSDDELRVAIAEKCGWREIDVSRNAGLHPTNPRGIETLPSFETDLNTCHEFEKQLKDFEQIRYAMRIHEMTNADQTFGMGANYFRVLHATARQRCEAFLRVHGLWKDNPHPRKEREP